MNIVLDTRRDRRVARCTWTSDTVFWADFAGGCTKFDLLNRFC